MTNLSTCALLVMSCDAYEDLWPPFFALLKRHWADCPFPIFLGAEIKSFTDEGVVTLHSGAGSRNWSGRLIDYLEELPHDHVLLMLDDFFLRRPVPTSRIIHSLGFAQDSRAAAVRLVPLPGPTDVLPNEDGFGLCADGLPYRVSTQAAIWSRLALHDLLRSGESIWEFEHAGNERARGGSGQYYSAWKTILPYPGLLAHHVVEKGQWFPHQKFIFFRQNIGCDFTLRSTLSWRRTLLYHAARAFDRALDILPWRIKKRCKLKLRGFVHQFFPGLLFRLGGRPLQ